MDFKDTIIFKTSSKDKKELLQKIVKEGIAQGDFAAIRAEHYIPKLPQDTRLQRENKRI